MFDQQRQRRAAKRVKPGDGRPLQRFRWWQLPGRALFYLRLTDDDGHPAVYAVDVRHWQGQQGGDTKAHLYLNGRLHAVSKLPAAFPVPGGTVEVAMSAFGIKRCHYVTADGAAQQLTPDPASAEGRRARFDRNHPVLSRWLGALSLIMIVTGAVLVLAQLVESLSRTPPVAERVGIFDSPIHLPLWLNVALGVGAVLASVERALRLRYSWLDALAT